MVSRGLPRQAVVRPAATRAVVTLGVTSGAAAALAEARVAVTLGTAADLVVARRLVARRVVAHLGVAHRMLTNPAAFSGPLAKALAKPVLSHMLVPDLVALSRAADGSARGSGVAPHQAPTSNPSPQRPLAQPRPHP